VSDDILLPVTFQPLGIAALSEPLPENVSQEPGDVALMLLGDMLDDTASPLDTARRRYAEVTDETAEPMVVPSHEGIMRHVIRPLKEAKHCYVLGMPVACIAQAGLVGEMVALWRFRMLEPVVDGKRLDERLQRLLLGRPFDELRQVQRVDILKAIDTLDEETVQAFDKLRLIRNRYLHNMIEPQRDIDADARDSLQHATTLVAKTLNVKFREGRVVLPPKVMRYMRDILQTGSDEPNNSDASEADT